MKRLSRFALALAIGVASSSCARSRVDTAIPASSLPPFVVIHETSTKVNAEARDGGFLGVQYEAAIPFPAEAFLRHIQTVVAAHGFTPLHESWLNPGIRSSVYAGWSSYNDRTGREALGVYMWQAEWKRSNGDIVSYTLQYSTPSSPSLPIPTPSALSVRVSAAYFPSALASQILARLPRQ